MACNSCAKPFTLLRREKGCPGCGFSFCSNCLQHKLFLKKINAEAKVCVKCKRAAESKTDRGTKIQPPDAYYNRIGATSTDLSTNKAASTPTAACNEIDQQIHERLQKLKKDNIPKSSKTTEEEIAERLRKIKNIPTTSDAEIQERLAKLRGIPNIPETSTKFQPTLPAPDLRSEQEQADDLMRQYMEQTKIDSQYRDTFDNVVAGIETRLGKLKGDDGKSGLVEHEGDDDDDDVVRKIVDKYKAQAALEEDEASPPTDELPFCEICNEDASLRCLGCRYLYCRPCYLEHKDDDDGCNRYEPYKGRPTQS